MVQPVQPVQPVGGQIRRPGFVPHAGPLGGLLVTKRQLLAVVLSLVVLGAGATALAWSRGSAGHSFTGKAGSSTTPAATTPTPSPTQVVAEPATLLYSQQGTGSTTISHALPASVTVVTVRSYASARQQARH